MPAATSTTSAHMARSTARSVFTRSPTASQPTTVGCLRYLGSTALQDTYPKPTRWPARPSSAYAIDSEGFAVASSRGARDAPRVPTISRAAVSLLELLHGVRIRIG